MSHLPNEELISAAAGELGQAGASELGVIASLRAQGHEPEAVRAAIEQCELRSKAGIAWKPGGQTRQHWLLTRDGLEQASHPLVAQFHANLIVQSGVNHVIDLTAGLGSDSAAFIEAGLHVTALERHPDTAAFLAHNVPEATVLTRDCTEVDFAHYLAAQYTIFIDPARRVGSRTADGARALPERDPERWSPSLSFVTALADRFQIYMKAAPAFAPPRGWASFMISVDGTLIEMFTTNAMTGVHAVMIDSRTEQANVISTSPNPTKSVANDICIGGFLYELDPAITRAGLSQQVAGELGVSPVGEKGIWLFGTSSVPFAHARQYEVHDHFPIKDVKSRVAHLPGIAIKTKDSRRGLKELRKASGKGDHNDWAIVVLGSGASELAVLVQREP